MSAAIRRDILALVLLNTLEAERHLRGPLLMEFIAALPRDEHFVTTVMTASILLHRVKRHEIGDTDFLRSIDQLRAMLAMPRARCPDDCANVTK